MNIPVLIWLFSFVPVILFSFMLWSDIYKKKQFGKRPLYLFISIILLGVIGLLVGLSVIFPSVFPAESSYAQFAVFTVLYLVVFFFVEYSVHSQRMVRSFFIDEFRRRLKKYNIFLACIALLAVLAVLVFFLRHSFTGSIVKASTLFSLDHIQRLEKANLLAAEDFHFLTTIIYVLFSFLGFLFLVTKNRTIFNFQAGVIRENRLLFFSSLSIFIIFFFVFLLHGLASDAPLVLFFLLNVSYLVRIVIEYFYQRTRNLDRILIKQEQTLQLKNELVSNVVGSPMEEDISVIRTTITDEIERARSLLPMREYGISGTIIYTREGNILKVSSPEHIQGFCIPLSRLETLKLYKNKEQLAETIMRTPFDIYKIISTPEELIPNWGEKLIKRILEMKKELMVEELPDEVKGLQRFIALYPVFDRDNLMGVLVVFKDSFDKFFPEEENALDALVESLKVIFAIIQGKQIQRDRNRLQGEMEIAKQIQTSIVPKKITIEGYECATNMITATEVGGDVYDFFQAPSGAYLGIGDVSGHGLPAGITALIQLVAFQSAVRTASAFDKTLAPHELYDLVNRILCEINKNRIGSDKFMTANYFLEKDGIFSYAGTHVIALCYRKKANEVVEITELANRTAFMGISENIDAKASSGELTLATNDVLLLYTDGIIEAKDHYSHQYGIPRLKQLFLGNASRPLEEIIDAVMKNVTDHARTGDMKKYKGNLADDASLVLIRKV